MNLTKYLAESEKVYNFRIKAAAPLTKEVVARIELYLQKFRPKSISQPRKTIMQKCPMDFTNLANAEIWIIDATTTLPCSSYVMQQAIRDIMNVPENYIVVRGENEPLELENTRQTQERELKDTAEKEGLTQAPLLGTDSEYPEAERGVDGQNYYGDGYNGRLLQYLKTVSEENQPKKVDAPSPLFKWLDMPKEAQDPVQPSEDFNADIKRPEVKAADPDAKKQAPNGNFDSEGDVVKRTFNTKSGKTRVQSAQPTTVRKA
jgi:hypothetical protein